MLPRGMVMAQLQGARDHHGLWRRVDGISKEWFPRFGSHILPCPSGCAADTNTHSTPGLDAGERILWELNQTYGRSHTCGSKWHLWNEEQASILGTACSSKPSERAVWDALFQRHPDWKGGCDTQPTQFVFSPPHLDIWRNHRYKHVFSYPVVTSSRNGVCACCIRGMGWWPVAAWKTLGTSVLPTEAPQHPVRWLSGRTASPQSDAFGNVTLSGTTAIWECRYSWSLLLSTHLRLHAVAGKIESTVSEIVQKAHS